MLNGQRGFMLEFPFRRRMLAKGKSLHHNSWIIDEIIVETFGHFIDYAIRCVEFNFLCVTHFAFIFQALFKNSFIMLFFVFIKSSWFGISIKSCNMVLGAIRLCKVRLKRANGIYWSDKLGFEESSSSTEKLLYGIFWS